MFYRGGVHSLPTIPKAMNREYDLFSKVLMKIKDGMTITFTKNNIAEGDDFLIFSASKSITVTFKQPNDLWWVLFDGDEPMLLENVPDSFLRSILKNI